MKAQVRPRPWFRLNDYILIAMLAAMGVAIKAVVVPLAQVITGPLFIPGGVVAGGFYMLFLVLATALTGRLGAATLTGLVQALLVIISGTLGSHGALSLLTYTLPGLAVDLLYLVMGKRHRACCALCCFLGGMVANISGSLSVNLAIFQLSLTPLLLCVAVAALSGGLGGLIANALAGRLRRLGVLNGRKAPKPKEDEPS